MLYVTSYRSKFNKKKLNEKYDENHSFQLVESLGSIKNIKSVSIEHKRLKLNLIDLKLVKANVLKDLQTPAILKGKEVTLLIKNNPELVYQYINQKLKGA